MSRKKTRRVRSTKREVEDVPMTPMIDVVFQMLIYFVLTFEIPDKMSQMQVWRPAGESAPSKEQEVVELTRITVYGPQPGSPNGYYALNDTRRSLATLEKAFNRFADLNPSQNIIVVATADSKHKDLVALLNILSKAGLENVSLLSSN
ncbi:biopolymer transporter ExbD [Kiritimatiellaeota bacterium B1221]|nr:biopolymer transporter ExbD [Kiritimatiellaeota bacterium B1221]